MSIASALPSTTTRVARFSPSQVNERVIRQMERDISRYADNPEKIAARLRELDREWDIDRAIETWAAGAISVITLLGFTRNRKLHALGWGVGAFLLSHALIGWCPPTMVMRLAGFRTAHEIESEKTALKVIRGDFSRGLKNDNVHALINEVDPGFFQA